MSFTSLTELSVIGRSSKVGFYKSITLIKVFNHFFQALGRDFRLILSPKKGLLHPKFRAVEMDDNNIEKPIRIDHETFYDGRVYGETKSRYVY